MKNWSFRGKTILGIALIEAFALGVLIVSSLSFLSGSNDDELRKRANTTASVLAAAITDAVIATDYAALESVAHGVLGNPGVVYVRILGRDGVLLSQGGDPGILGNRFVEDHHLADVVDGVFDTSAAIAVNAIDYGRVELGIATAAVHELLDNARTRMYTIAAAEMVLVALFSWWLGSYLTRGLRSLRHAARRVTAGDYEQLAAVSGTDELADTARAFNDMSTQLALAAAERRTAERALRDLNDELEQRIRVRTRELNAANQVLEHSALHDSLTNLPNRALFHNRLEHSIGAYTRNKKKHALLMLDLDRFKTANDTLGHHFGDLVLREIAQRVGQCVRPSDTLARVGGDEFAVLLDEVGSRDEASKVAQRIRDAIEKPLLLDGHKADVGASIGIALFPDDAADAIELMQNADIAMYEAKAAKLGVEFYNAKLGERHKSHAFLLADLREAIKENHLLLHFQPKIDLSTDTLAGVEVLLRWQHPERGLLYPDAFIPAAEQSGLIKPLTIWVLREALKYCAKWHAAQRDLHIAVNISAANLQDPEFPGHVAELLQEVPVPARLLEMEITETAVMMNPHRAIENIGTLVGMGITMSIDDFGTGYSSMAYLKQLILARIKIDKSFVMDMLNNKSDEVIVRSTIDLGHNLGLKVVAEGVESVEAWDRLKALGCDAAQGYYISKPMPREQLETWLAESQWRSN